MNLPDKLFFTRQLMLWNTQSNGRKMPWKGEKNPYKIWLSEIILQQTRVEQGWDYYNKFIQKYPSIQDLAAGADTEIFKLWEGLGYYSRCRNLITTARHISNNLAGIFPNQYDALIKLKGVGPYTAAAIGSFAFDLPYAVLDGNVYRVLSRYMAIDIVVNSIEGKNYFTKLSGQLLDTKSPAAYNQAIMDFGATICKPRPLCSQCPLQKKCIAFNTNTIDRYPLKQKKGIRKIRWFYYFIAEFKGKFFIRKREKKDIWQSLHELILFESDHELKDDEMFQSDVFEEFGKDARIIEISQMYKQHLTHQTIKGRFIHVMLTHSPQIKGYKLVNRPAILKLAFPKYITSYFEESRILY